MCDISVGSYRDATKEEREDAKKTWNTFNFDFAAVSIKEMYIDSGDNIYLPQEMRAPDKNLITGVYRLGKNKNAVEKDKIEKYNEVKNDYYAAERRINDSCKVIASKNGDIEIVSLRLIKNTSAPGQKTSKTHLGIKFIKMDKSKNIYSYIVRLAFGINPHKVKKYTPSGKLIAEIDLQKFVNATQPMNVPAIVSDIFISKNGNIFYLEIIPDAERPQWFSFSKGLKIVKMEPRKGK